ncbi:MAG: right-handed parallel beta-helix repeat-containing protein [Pirellulaceae bacterium]
MAVKNVLPVALTVALILAAMSASAEDPLRLYVAVNGDDNWSGRLAEPNTENTDGPKASLQGARDAIRALREDGALTGAVEVLVREGRYRLWKGFRLEPEDSGSPGASVSYAAYPKEDPVFSGGRPISGWRETEDGLWTTHLSAVETGSWYFRQLWVNGRRAQRARSPNKGYLHLENLIKPHDRDDERNRQGFRFKESDLDGDWTNLEDIEIVKMFSWSTTRMPVAAIDDERNVVTFTGKTGKHPRLFTWAGDRYYVENVFEGLDEPGEWYLNRKTGILYYHPRPGERIDQIEAFAPVVERLVEFAGDTESGEAVHHVHLRGLTFEHSTWPMPETGWPERQAQTGMITAGLFAEVAEDCVIEDCEFRHIGTHGMWLYTGCQRNRIERCHTWDCGAGGVYLGAMDNQTAGHNTVHNCFIHHLTEAHGGAIGVWIGRSSHNEVSRCDIGDTNYTGVSVGWSWGYAESSAHHNLIADNHIHHCGHRKLSDMGGIYTLGVSPGTRLRHNRIHDIWSNPGYSHGSGIYPDEGSSEITIEDNIVYRCTSAGFHLHYGRDLQVENNVFALARRHGIHRSREEDHTSFVFEHNIVLSEHPDILGGRWTNRNYVMDRNLYWCTTGEPVSFNGRSLQEWQQMGNDEHSLIVRPQFRAPRQGDFTLAEDSPAGKIGFEPIDQDGIGLYGDASWVNLPGQFDHQPDDPLPPEPEPTEVSTGFETIPGSGERAPLGSHPPGASVHTEGHPELVGITDETAASGTRSLKIADSPQMERSYNPHIYYRPHYRKGRAQCSFDVRIEEGAVFYHQWRDYRGRYAVGPSLTVRQGSLMVGDSELLQLPVDEWVHIEVTAPIGTDRGTWKLEVTLPGQSPRLFEDLANGSARFLELDWVGFVSSATEKTALYLDNIEIHPMQ